MDAIAKEVQHVKGKKAAACILTDIICVQGIWHLTCKQSGEQRASVL